MIESILSRSLKKVNEWTAIRFNGHDEAAATHAPFQGAFKSVADLVYSHAKAELDAATAGAGRRHGKAGAAATSGFVCGRRDSRYGCDNSAMVFTNRKDKG